MGFYPDARPTTDPFLTTDRLAVVFQVDAAVAVELFTQFLPHFQTEL